MQEILSSTAHTTDTLSVTVLGIQIEKWSLWAQKLSKFVCQLLPEISLNKQYYANIKRVNGKVER